MNSHDAIEVPVPDSESDNDSLGETHNGDRVDSVPDFEQELKGLRQEFREAHQDAECSICLKLLCEPATLACGHSFCRLCLSTSQQFSVACALCRSQQPGPLPAPNIILCALLKRFFPEDYARRVEEARAEEELRFDWFPKPQFDAAVQTALGRDQAALERGRAALTVNSIFGQQPSFFSLAAVSSESSEMGQDGMFVDAGNHLMTVHEMRTLMEEGGLPLMVYNSQLATEPKRLVLNPSHTALILVDNDNDEWEFEDGVLPAVQEISFDLHDLERIQVGPRCQFASPLQQATATEYSNTPSWLSDDIPSVHDAFSIMLDRIACFQFPAGSLCVRFLSPSLRTAAMNVIREIKPDCVFEA